MKNGLLSIIATPIGNLGDWTYRAVDTAKMADIIACEDTRITRKLLNHYNISTPLISYHEHSDDKKRDNIITKLQAGEHVALMSDAGTPLISDPGYKLIKSAMDHGLKIETIPGPSSVTAALSISGLPTDNFTFLGFLPSKKTARKNKLKEFSEIKSTLVIFESAKRISDSLEDALDILGNREATIARELTKLYEESINGEIEQLQAIIEQRPIKGEIVLMIAPPADNQNFKAEELTKMLVAELDLHHTKDAVKIVAEQTGVSRKLLYDLALKIKNQE